jgi:mRNA interferase RelE/StbE
MEKYKIEFKQSVVKELLSIPKKDLKRIILKIQALAIDPRGKLSNSNEKLQDIVFR